MMTESQSVKKRLPMEVMCVLGLVVGLFFTVTAVSIWFYYNPPIPEKESMFADDPNMTNSSPSRLLLQNSPPSDTNAAPTEP